MRSFQSPSRTAKSGKGSLAGPGRSGGRSQKRGLVRTGLLETEEGVAEVLAVHQFTVSGLGTGERQHRREEVDAGDDRRVVGACRRRIC